MLTSLVDIGQLLTLAGVNAWKEYGMVVIRLHGLSCVNIVNIETDRILKGLAFNRYHEFAGWTPSKSFAAGW